MKRILKKIILIWGISLLITSSDSEANNKIQFIIFPEKMTFGNCHFVQRASVLGSEIIIATKLFERNGIQ